MTECPGCGEPLAGDETTCPACGVLLEEAVPSVAPEIDGEESGKRCPHCDTLNPEEARYCVRCRHSFEGETTFFGINYLVVPAVLVIVLVIAAAMAFSTGLVGGGDVVKTPAGSAAHSGAGTAIQQVINQTRTVTPHATPPLEVVGTRNTTATLNATPTRTVDPNATPWNGAQGSGIYHTEGGTHYVEDSNELMLLRRAAAATPTPIGGGDGSGHATGPLSWVGTGNWSPGFVSLPAGDAQVVLLSQGTTAFILSDAAGTQAGFGVFLPPGGTYTVPIPEAGSYVIAFGTANATDIWSAMIALPGNGGQALAPPVATPATQVLSFAGTGGGTPGSFNLTPGTLHVALTADQMTMAYIKDPWGVTLSTTVAGPYPGGSTVAITQTGTYRLAIWGTGTWTATVTWTGTPGTGGPTVPTVQPVTTLTPWNSTATPATNVTAALINTTPTTIATAALTTKISTTATGSTAMTTAPTATIATTAAAVTTTTGPTTVTTAPTTTVSTTVTPGSSFTAVDVRFVTEFVRADVELNESVEKILEADATGDYPACYAAARDLSAQASSWSTELQSIPVSQHLVEIQLLSVMEFDEANLAGEYLGDYAAALEDGDVPLATSYAQEGVLRLQRCYGYRAMAVEELNALLTSSP